LEKSDGDARIKVAEHDARHRAKLKGEGENQCALKLKSEKQKTHGICRSMEAGKGETVSSGVYPRESNAHQWKRGLAVTKKQSDRWKPTTVETDDSAYCHRG
jgi:hypothetical protein